MKSTLFIFVLVSLLAYANTNPYGMYCAHWAMELANKKRLKFGPFKVTSSSPGKNSDT